MNKIALAFLFALSLVAVGFGVSAHLRASRIIPRYPTHGFLEEPDLTQVAGQSVNLQNGDVAIELRPKLSGGNVDARWFCGDPLNHADFEGTWEQVGGAAVFNPSRRRLSGLTIDFLLDSITGAGSASPAPNSILNMMRSSWFNSARHPVATFTAKRIEPRTPTDEPPGWAIKDWTHLIEGELDLNGVKKDLIVPAVVEVDDLRFSIDAHLVINRPGFKIDGDQADWIHDNEVRISITIVGESSLDYLELRRRSELLALEGVIRQQQHQLAEYQKELHFWADRAVVNEARLNAFWRSRLSASRAGALPGRFTDHVLYPNAEPVPFEMVLIPENGASGIQPFYMSATEVTWDMFYDWAYSTDIGPDESATLQRVGLRPSPLYEDSVQLRFGLGRRPALSMSMLTAEAFCIWLSEKTGRVYRLPTRVEWEYVLKEGGGVPTSREALLKQAWLKENSEAFADPLDPFSVFEEPATSEVGSLEPNALGIYDMIGNVAEWVIADNQAGQKTVRGGHFLTPADEFYVGWRAIENQDSWNATYPQQPLSRFWYRDYYFTGIRLVCEPVNVPVGE